MKFFFNLLTHTKLYYFILKEKFALISLTLFKNFFQCISKRFKFLELIQIFFKTKSDQLRKIEYKNKINFPIIIELIKKLKNKLFKFTRNKT